MLQIEAATPFAPSLEFVDSSAHMDRSGQSAFSFNIKLDICVYNKNGQHQGPTDVAHVELIIKFKWQSSNDLFCDPYEPLEDDDPTILCEGKACADYESLNANLRLVLLT
jgi:hypothetical protein